MMMTRTKARAPVSSEVGTPAPDKSNLRRVRQVENEIEVETLSKPADAGEPERRTPSVDGPGPMGNSNAKDLSASPEVKALKRAEDQAVSDWLRGLSVTGPIKVNIIREKPSFHEGIKTDGHLDTVNTFISEEEMRDQYGGGDYTLKVQRKDGRGSWVFFSQTQVKVAGHPRIDNLPQSAKKEPPPAPVVVKEDNSTANMAMKFMGEQLERMNRNGDRSNLGDIQLLLAPLQKSMELMQIQLNAKDDRILELSRAPVNPVENKLLSKLIDDDSARVQAVKTALESEIRQVKENATANESRLRDQHARDIEGIERRHTREVDTLTASYTREAAAVKTSIEVQVSVKDSEIRRMERELTELRADLKEVRGTKEQSISDKIKEVKAIAELAGAGESDEEESAIEKVAKVIVSSPAANNLAAKFLGGQQPPAQQQVQQQPRQRFKKGQVVRQKGTGRTFQMTDRGLQEVRQQPAQQQAAAQPANQPAPISPELLKNSVQMLENAYKNNIPPATVAVSARTQIPAEIMQALSDHVGRNPERGVDEFLRQVAQLPGTSPLATQAGRNWAREVGRALVGQA